MAKGMEAGTKIIIGAIALIIGLILLPVMANFIRLAKQDNTSGYGESPVSNISGLSAVIDLIAYGFCFGLVGVGVGMIYFGFKHK